MAENTNPALILDTNDKTVADVIADGKVNKVCYKTYVDQFKITTKEHVSEHVAALAAAAYPTGQAKNKAEWKRFTMRVRAGLNYYVKSDDNDDSKTPDWVALVRQAAKNAHDKGKIDNKTIMAAVEQALAGK